MLSAGWELSGAQTDTCHGAFFYVPFIVLPPASFPLRLLYTAIGELEVSYVD